MLTMEKQGTAYERFCTKVVKQLETQNDSFLNVKMTNIKHDDHIVGKTGVKHQIDISADYKDKNGKITPIDIECKDYNSNVPMEKIATLDSVARDIGAMPVFMAKVGYQNGAQIYANKLDRPIKTFKVTDSKHASWDKHNLIRNIDIGMNAIIYNPEELHITPRYPKDSFQGKVCLTNAYFLNKDLTVIESLKSWLKRTQYNAIKSKQIVYSETLSFNNGEFLKLRDENIPIIKAEITWRDVSIHQQIRVSADNLILGIVEDIETGDWYIAHKIQK